MSIGPRQHRVIKKIAFEKGARCHAGERARCDGTGAQGVASVGHAVFALTLWCGHPAWREAPADYPARGHGVVAVTA